MGTTAETTALALGADGADTGRDGLSGQKLLLCAHQLFQTLSPEEQNSPPKGGPRGLQPSVEATRSLHVHCALGGPWAWQRHRLGCWHRGRD